MSFNRVMGDLHTAEPLRPEDLRGRDLAGLDLVRRLRRRGVLILEFRDEEEVVRQLKAAGGVAMKQYECVRENLPVLTRLETVAKSDGISSAVIAKHTDPHQDGYQFESRYRGHEIAAGNDMPAVEGLGYPRVVEERHLTFYDLRKAALRLASLRERHVERLCRPLFKIDPKYRQADPALAKSGRFPVLYVDPVVGVRFRFGGGITTDDSEANTALALFRDEVVNAKLLTMELQPDLLFMVWQARVAHRGVRTVGRPGLTILTRELWNFPGGVE